MSYERLPIVGAHFGPQRGSPSKALIAVLGIGDPLFLLAEPDNPADPNAIAVYLESANLSEASQEALPEQLAPFGFDLEQIMSQDQWHLGYIPRNFAGLLKDAGVVVDGFPLDVTFGTNPKGEPRVVFAEPVL